ncbi:hypothetical protein [Parasphingopyxis sp.]|uniref:hypothetical protein n=1 Tax=Parasphingopyxis sp. TaxID=1920299 RepID=UPI00262FCC6A|nr:hypothetical protein [Parasphingopyxis sp.]
MASRGPFSSMTLMQATITFVVAFVAINVAFDVMRGREIAWVMHTAFGVLAAPIWYLFIRWMRSRNA